LEGHKDDSAGVTEDLDVMTIQEVLMRIADLLAEQRVAFEFLPHPPAFTAQKLAKYLHVSGNQVAKSVLIKGSSGFLLAVLPATHHIDTDQLSRLLDGPVRLASHREIAEVFRDCEWGVVPPFGRLYGLRTLLDDTIPPEALIVFEAHTHVEAIRLSCRDFERLEQPRRLRFARLALS
jgi:Ala-tRNA(Pro) deacylase